MTRNIPLDRPALTALAAAMALSATPAFAQTAEPAAPPSVTLPPAQSAIPAASPATAPLPGANTSLPPVTVTMPPAAAPAPAPVMQASPAPTLPPVAEAPAPERAAPRTPSAQPAPEPEAAQTVARAPRAAPARTVTPVPEPAAVASTMAPAAPLAAPATPAPMAEPAPAEQAAPVAAPLAAEAVSNEGEALWILGAGGVMLALGVGALVTLRRRDRREDAREQAVIDTPLTASTRVAPVQPAPLQPVMAAAPAYGISHGRPQAPIVSGGQHGALGNRLEAMVAAAPSAENPFLTRRKRLRRAGFILAHGHAPATMMPEIEPVAVPTPAPVAAAVRADRQPAKVARPASYVSPTWKPATT